VLRQVAISCLLAVLALPAVARTRPHYGGILRVEMEGDPWQQPGSLARRLVLDGLTLINPEGLVEPALATEWKSDGSDRRWQFRLRPGVHFHDGTPLTSTAVVASLSTSCTANCPWATIHAVGSSIVFTGESPMPSLPELMAGDNYRIVGVGSSGTGGIIGTGPFQPSGFANGVLTLAANDTCWQGRPFVDAVEIHARRSIRDQWLDLSIGRADLVEVPAEQLRQAQQQRLPVVVSAPVTLLALQVADSGSLANSMLRAAMALAVDRTALYNVIFQKQGEVTASMLPAALTGYSFLFPTERDLNKARELRGGLTPPPLTLVAEGGSTMQLAAQRIALNLREAGFNVQVTNSTTAHPDLVLRRLLLECNQPQAALESMLRNMGQTAPVIENTPAALFKVEHEVLDRDSLIPLLYLPRQFARSGRVRDLRLAADGTPDLARVSLEDAQ
jgi:MarR-like DNA-binding transcriptional regulator SgrR of sgrS sRNA